ncbi:MAG: WYL domain-containing protein, partial [Candidatus Zixiibacteriota bacterium]
DVEVLDDTFFKNPDISPEVYFEGSWSLFSGDPITVEVIFSGAAARIVSSTTHHPGEHIESVDNDRVKYSVTTRGLEEIQRWILGFGDEAEVIAPTELRNRLWQISQRLSERYK